MKYSTCNWIEKLATWLVINYLICLIPAFSSLIFTASRIPAASGYITHALSLLVVCWYPHMLNNIAEKTPGGGVTKSFSFAFMAIYFILFPTLNYSTTLQKYVGDYFWPLVLITIIPTALVAILLSWGSIKEVIEKAQAEYDQRQAADTAQRVRGMKDRIAI